MGPASMRRSPPGQSASPADRSLAFQADVQHDNPQFPYVRTAGRYGLIQLKIDAQRIAREQAGWNFPDVNVVTGRSVSFGGKRAAGGGCRKRDALQFLDGYRRDSQLDG